MQIFRPDKPAQSALENLQVPSTTVRDIEARLNSLQDFDQVTEEQLMTELVSAYHQLRNEGPIFEALVTAVLMCGKAVEYNLQVDPIYEEWASWPGRYEWLTLELQAVSQQSCDSELTEKLSELRDKYAAVDGDPVNSQKIKEAHKVRKALAHARVALSDLDQVIDKSLRSWPIYDNCTVFFALVDPLNELEIDYSKTILSELLYQIAEKPKDPEPFLRQLYSETLKLVNSSKVNNQFEALRNVDDEVVNKVLTGLRIQNYSHSYLPDECFWKRAQACLSGFRKVSDKYPCFSRSELEMQLKQEGSYLVALDFEDQLVNFSLVIDRKENFLPRTRTKLEQLSPLLLTQKDVHTWNFLYTANPHTLMNLRRYAIDWSSLLIEAVSDLAITLGSENILGTVELDNPAVKSHRRVGFEALPSNKKFTSDGGKEAVIFRKNLFPVF